MIAEHGKKPVPNNKKKAEPFRSCNLRRRAENKKPKGERINCFLLESFLRGFSIKSLISMALPAKQKTTGKRKLTGRILLPAGVDC